MDFEFSNYFHAFFSLKTKLKQGLKKIDWQLCIPKLTHFFGKCNHSIGKLKNPLSWLELMVVVRWPSSVPFKGALLPPPMFVSSQTLSFLNPFALRLCVRFIFYLKGKEGSATVRKGRSLSLQTYLITGAHGHRNLSIFVFSWQKPWKGGIPKGWVQPIHRSVWVLGSPEGAE